MSPLRRAAANKTPTASSKPRAPAGESPLAALALQNQWRNFGALLRDRRNAAGLSRVDLASKAKVSDATIKFIETAHHRPSRATLIRLLDATELHLTWAEVPGNHEPPADKQNSPALAPQMPPLDTKEPSPDPAHFLMDLIGFDEILLPQGVPENLRIFQQRPKVAGKPDDK